MKKILYYILNLTFHTLDKDIIKLIGNKNKLIIFDVGCYRGVFFKKIYYKLKSNNKKLIFHLFDINPNVKKYINKFLFLKNFFYREISLSNKNGVADYHYNSFFESSGSSLSKIYKNDKFWVFSRKFILTLLLQSTKNYIK